jgi:endonuclease YncB( thermonuclease family)
MRKDICIVFILSLAILTTTATAAPKEASGTVIGVDCGDVFDVLMIEEDPRTGSGVVTVKLADVILSEIESAEGEGAKEFAEAHLMNRTVWLDIDDLSVAGRDPLGRLLCVVYLEEPDGRINLTHPFNRLLVDAGHAEAHDFQEDEFDPAEWWPAWVVINEVEANPEGSDAGNEWVELYNDGRDDADVSNWTLTTAGGSVVLLEAGTIVPAGGFFVVTAGGYWLQNSDELVILRDERGVEVDRTPALDDQDDDLNSWSRYPDGGDEWIRIEASPGLPVPPIELSMGTISDLAKESDNWLIWSDGPPPSGLWDVSDFLKS